MTVNYNFAPYKGKLVPSVAADPSTPDPEGYRIMVVVIFEVISSQKSAITR